MISEQVLKDHTEALRANTAAIERLLSMGSYVVPAVPAAGATLTHSASSKLSANKIIEYKAKQLLQKKAPAIIHYINSRKL